MLRRYSEFYTWNLSVAWKLQKRETRSSDTALYKS